MMYAKYLDPKAYVAQSKRGGDYSGIQPVYALNCMHLTEDEVTHEMS